MKHLVLLSIYILCYTSNAKAQCPTLKDSTCRCKDSVPPPQYLRNGSFEAYSPTPCPDILNYGSAFRGSQSPKYWTYGARDDPPFLYVIGCPDYFSGRYAEQIYFPPLPMPDGKVFIGFDDIGSSGGNTNYGGKQYIATCLASTLKANTKYSFEFYLGFSPDDSEGTYFSTPYEIVIYGNPSCDSIPFAYVGDLGCPTNVGAKGGGYVKLGWIKLGSVYVNGRGEWVKARIDFVPPENINGFILGPNCEPVGASPGSRVDHFHYADNFSLTETSQLVFRTIKANSDNCSNGIVLHAPPAINVKTYQWYKDSIAITGATDSVYQVAAGSAARGNYNVRIVFTNKCILSDPLYVDLSLFNNFNLGKDTLLCYGQTLTLKPNIRNVNYLWQDGSTNNSFLVQQPGTYTVKLTNQFGCSVTKSIKVDFQQCSTCQLFVPTAFTPNGDGKNDVFQVKSLCAQINNFHLKIYNRWGQSIYETTDISQGWDGTYKRQLQLTGTYVYFISYKKYGVSSLQHQSGLVTLLK